MEMRVVVAALIVTASVTSMSASAYQGVDLGLVAHYPFDGTLDDVSGNGLDGAAQGSIVFVDAVHGQGAQFDGVTSAVLLRDPRILQLQYPMTMCVWMRRDSIADVQSFLGHGCGGYVFWMTSTLLSFGRQCGGGAVQAPSSIEADGLFHFVAVVADGITTTISVDLDAVVSDAMSVPFEYGGSPAWIGADPPLDEYFHGVLDDVRIYSRALSLCELEALFDGVGSADLDGDGDVGTVDLLTLLAAWGPCDVPCPEDIDGSGAVDVQDLLALLGAWGPCT